MTRPLRISIVTPSFNQAPFLEETITSVLDNGYQHIEYIVMDGGSTDGSIDIIKKRANRITHWQSEKDNGQYDAINRGFARTTGDVMAWINSDDKYLPGALSIVAEIFEKFPEVQWLTTLYPIHWDAQGRAIRCKFFPGFSSRAFWRGENLPGAGWKATTAWIQQESTFWRRSLWEQAGAKLDASHNLAGDFELWARFFKITELYGVSTPLGGFRSHGNQKTGQALDRYTHDCKKVFFDMGGAPPGKVTGFARQRLLKYVPVRVAAPLGWMEKRKIISHVGGRGWSIVSI